MRSTASSRRAGVRVLKYPPGLGVRRLSLLVTGARAPLNLVPVELEVDARRKVLGREQRVVEPVPPEEVDRSRRSAHDKNRSRDPMLRQ